MDDALPLHDTHAHLHDSAFGMDFDEMLVRAKQSGVDRILCMGSDLASSRRVVSLAQQYSMIWAAVGVHPHEAGKFEEEAQGIDALLDEPRVIAVGEIGLDFFRNRSSRQDQIKAFEAQLALAEHRNLPVSVHNRNADCEVLEILHTVSVTAVLHCYSGSWTFAQDALDAGIYLSFAGNLTYPKATELRRVASELPIESALIETDSPVLAPQPTRGKRNEPSLMKHTFEAFASLRQMEPREASSALQQNSYRVFRWELD